MSSSKLDEDTANDLEAVLAAEQERNEIIARYIKGKDSKESVDNWEDSAFIVYKVTDRFGFLHQNELPGKDTGEEERKKQKEVKRQYKWIAMLHKGPSCMTTTKFRSRVYKGIPLSIRGDAWMLMLNIQEVIQKKPRIYEKMKKRAKESSFDIKQIDVDVNRTFRDHIMFRNRFGVKQQQLFYVLSAYSMYNTEVGYCQGMSQIAALLLMFMGEEEAFWGLHALLNDKKYNMHGFFIPGFPKLLRFQSHHDKILEKFLPKLKKHLDKLEIYSNLYTLKWFFQCFLDRTPFPLTLRLWDVYILEGERVLVAMAYTTMKVHKTNLKRMSMESIVKFFQDRLATDFGMDDDTVIKALQTSMSELRRYHMDLPPPPPTQDEIPKRVFGQRVKPTFQQITGLRSSRINSVDAQIESSAKLEVVDDNFVPPKTDIEIPNKLLLQPTVESQLSLFREHVKHVDSTSSSEITWIRRLQDYELNAGGEASNTTDFYSTATTLHDSADALQLGVSLPKVSQHVAQDSNTFKVPVTKNSEKISLSSCPTSAKIVWKPTSKIVPNLQNVNSNQVQFGGGGFDDGVSSQSIHHTSLFLSTTVDRPLVNIKKARNQPINVIPNMQPLRIRSTYL